MTEQVFRAAKVVAQLVDFFCIGASLPFLLVLWADSLLRRRIARRTLGRWTGFVIESWPQRRPRENIVATTKPSNFSISWWKCVLPWPGKRRWAETVLAKAALLGATFDYVSVSSFDWDEAWVTKINEHQIIASSNKVAVALAVLKYHDIQP